MKQQDDYFGVWLLLQLKLALSRGLDAATLIPLPKSPLKTTLTLNILVSEADRAELQDPPDEQTSQTQSAPCFCHNRADLERSFESGLTNDW
jgi:hypothetical protein